MKFKETKVSSKEVYKTSFLEIFEDQILLPNNQAASRIYVNHIGAAAVLPITTDKKIVLTRQYRYPIGEISLEIPAGKKDAKEELGLDCVKRELEEETGYQSTKIKHLFDFFTCVGYSNEKIELFLALDCELQANRLQPDEDEFIEVVLYTLEEVVELLEKNIITDAKTIMAIQSYLLLR